MKYATVVLMIALFASLLLFAIDVATAGQANRNVYTGGSASRQPVVDDEPKPFSFEFENIAGNTLRSGNVAVPILALQFLFLYITSKLAKVEFSSGVSAILAALVCALSFLLISVSRVQFWHMEFTDVVQTSVIAANVITLLTTPYFF